MDQSRLDSMISCDMWIEEMPGAWGPYTYYVTPRDVKGVRNWLKKCYYYLFYMLKAYRGR